MKKYTKRYTSESLGFTLNHMILKKVGTIDEIGECFGANEIE
jgi:hypothetical protein